MHYSDIIMGAMASQVTSLTIVYSSVYSGQRKHQSSAPLAFVRGIHRSPVNSLHKWPVTRKMFPFDDVIFEWWEVAKPNDAPIYPPATPHHQTYVIPLRLSRCMHYCIYLIHYWGYHPVFKANQLQRVSRWNTRRFRLTGKDKKVSGWWP